MNGPLRHVTRAACLAWFATRAALADVPVSEPPPSAVPAEPPPSVVFAEPPLATVYAPTTVFAVPPLAIQEASLTDAAGTPTASVLLVERHAAPLVTVELRLATEGLIDGGRITQGAVAALNTVWEGPWSTGPRGAIARMGGKASVDCGWRLCTLTLHTPAAALPEALDAFADLLRAPALDGEALSDWRRDQAERHRYATKNTSVIAAWASTRLLWPGTKRAVAPDARFRAVSAGALEATWRRILAEGQPSIAVAGDTTMATILPLLQADFGHLRGTIGWPVEAGPSLDEERVVLVDVPWTSRPLVRVAWASPGALDPDQPAWQVAWRALAGGMGARMLARLREADGLLYSMGGDYLEVSATAGWSSLELVVNEADLGAALVALDEELDRLQRDGLAPEELRGAVEGQIGWEALRLLDREALTGHLKRYGDLPAAHFAVRFPAYREVTLEQVNAAARTWLTQPRTWIVVGDRDAIEPVLAKRSESVTQWTACRAVRGRRCR